MDWKEQLTTVVEEGMIQLLDVRFICMKQQGKWYLKRFHVTVFHQEVSIPEQVLYPSYLFLRHTMRAPDFLHLISDLTDLTARNSFPTEEWARLTEEEKLKTFQVSKWDIWCESVSINFNVHAQGNSLWGVSDHVLPFWSFGGSIFPDIPENQEPLIASEVPYFPTPLEGQAWYLYGKAVQGSNNYLASIDISLDDNRAFLQDVVLDEKTSTLRCRCEGKHLSRVTLRLYTNVPQLAEKQAGQEVIFQLQGQPTVISLALTFADSWLDKKEINLNYPQLGIPKGVTVVGRSFRPEREVATYATPVIEEIVQSDSSGIAAIIGPHLKLVDGYYNNVLQQSRRSFSWAIVGFIGVFIFFAGAILLLMLRVSGNVTTLAASITALGGVASGLLTGYLLNLHKSASGQAAASQIYLDRIQRFFIANSACENLDDERKGSTREALIKKLSDV